jgi:hypothetical protein
MPNVFTPDFGSGDVLAVGTSSASKTIDGNSSSIYLFNDGTVTVFVRWSKGASNAVVNKDLAMPPGSIQTFGKDSRDTLSAICASGTSNLRYITGQGE